MDLNIRKMKNHPPSPMYKNVKFEKIKCKSLSKFYFSKIKKKWNCYAMHLAFGNEIKS